jgi:hypothetical protein
MLKSVGFFDSFYRSLVDRLRKRCEIIIEKPVRSFSQIKNVSAKTLQKLWQVVIFVQNFSPYFQIKSTWLLRWFLSHKNQVIHTIHKSYYDDYYILIRRGFWQQKVAISQVSLKRLKPMAKGGYL